MLTSFEIIVNDCAGAIIYFASPVFNFSDKSCSFLAILTIYKKVLICSSNISQCLLLFTLWRKMSCGSPLAEISETPTGRQLQKCTTANWNAETRKNDGCDYVKVDRR